MRIQDVVKKEKTCYLYQVEGGRVELYINGVYVADITDKQMTVEIHAVKGAGLEYHAF